MLRGSAWAARRDRAFASIEESRQSFVDWEEKRARRRADFAARIPVMAAEVASEVKAAVTAAVTAEVTATVTSALDAAFERRQEAIREALANALVRSRASSTMTLASSPSDLHAPVQDASFASERAMDIRTAAVDPISTTIGAASIANNFKFALAAPITCSTVFPGGGPSSPWAAEVLDSVASPPPIPMAVVYSPVTRPAPHTDIQLVCEDDVQAVEFTGAIGAPLSAAVHKADDGLTTPTSTVLDTSAVVEPNLYMAQPSTSSVVRLQPVRDVPVDILTHDTLDIVNSSGSDALASMAAPQDRPEGTDIAVTNEDEQQLVCARAEADDHSYVTNMSLMLLSQATFGVDDDHIVNNHEVLLPLKLLDLSVSASTELYVPPLLPQFTEAMVAWGTLLNQLSGMCSDHGSAITRSLLPWDSREETRVSGDSVLRRGTSVKHLNVELLDSYSHHHQPGGLLWYLFDSVVPFLISRAIQQKFMDRYRVTATVSRLLSSVVRYNEVVLLPFFLSATGNLIHFLPWNLGQPLYTMSTKLSMLEHGLVVMLTTASGIACLQGNSVQELVCGSVKVDRVTECMMALAALQPWPSWKNYFLVPAVYLSNWIVELVQLQPWPSWELSLSMLTWLDCFCDTPICSSWTYRMVLKRDGYWWLILWRTTEDNIILLQLHDALHTLLLFIDSKLSCKLEHPSLVTFPAMLYKVDHAANMHRLFSIGNLMLLAIAQENSDCVSPRNWVVTTASTYPYFSFTIFGMVASISPGFDDGQGSNMLHVCVAWPLVLECSPSDHNSGKTIIRTTVRCEGYLETRNAVSQQISARTMQAFHLANWSQCCHTVFHLSGMNHDLIVEVNEVRYSVLMPWPFYLLQATGSVLAMSSFSLLDYLLQSCNTGHGCLGGLAYFSSEVLLREELELLWDPGGRNFFGIFTRDEAQERRKATAPAYYRILYMGNAYYFSKAGADHDYYLDILCDHVHISHDYNLGTFLEQVRVICCLNLDKVCSNYSVRRDFGEIMTHQVPWDPSGSTWHRLGVKPKIKEGGMLATSPTATTVLGLGLPLLGLGYGKRQRQRLQVSTGSDTNRLALDWTAFGLLASVSFLSCLRSISILHG
ncbi:hypothetical protein ACQ4PT_006424 [Festuca glaucescens]